MPNIYNIFFAKQGERQTSGGHIEIPTRLPPREASILWPTNSKILLKKGGKYTRKGGTRSKPSEKKQKKT